jgi:hypothetical protein
VPKAAHSHPQLFESRSAVISECGNYRYRLDRIWNPTLPPLSFGMLNPSTADAQRNDATIERCERRARSMGFGRLIVWNLFAYRSTSPAALLIQKDVIGPDNDRHIRSALRECKTNGGIVIVGWGSFANYLDRQHFVLSTASEFGLPLHCLGVTKSGQPRHPLYVGYSTPLRAWSPQSSSSN